MEHTDNLHKSLDRYFIALESFGYYKPDGVKALLIYLFVVDAIFNGQLGTHLDDRGAAIINRLLWCLSKHGCLVARINTCNARLSRQRVGYVYELPRITESSINRITEDDVNRITEHNTKR